MQLYIANVCQYLCYVFFNPINGTDEVQESSFALFARLYWKYNKTNAFLSDLIWFHCREMWRQNMKKKKRRRMSTSHPKLMTEHKTCRQQILVCKACDQESVEIKSQVLTKSGKRMWPGNSDGFKWSLEVAITAFSTLWAIWPAATAGQNWAFLPKTDNLKIKHFHLVVLCLIFRCDSISS